ncbi:hypothetical protein P9G84_25445 [Brevibacillus centrosporus]|uniref:hypothetical protein n=1 Tax=Brevibacillus centrosporus TaxID=54910 RepID=UPI001142BDC4|nr:hypothetical protein [Brevibacillus centrosporus]MEC2132253.1 hypothetical protein [Brevibacillus centrosporus]GED33831.1 hypothetical protein BCE02nite_49720 [Brevibacillus centrosporus]
MKKIFSPKEIPLHYFYIAWKKARHFAQTSYGIFDPVEISDFEMNLDTRLQNIKHDFKIFDDVKPYKMEETIAYLLPKAPKNDHKRYRPMVQFSLRDQVAWTVVVLVLSEWFDTNEEIGKLIPVNETELRKTYNWMVPWSYNNRLKRIFQKNEFDGSYERLYIHYNHKSLYESFQWSLRNLREQRVREFEKVLESYEEAYYGEADIKEFYPTLRREHILQALKQRFEQLFEANVMSEDCVKQWNMLLKQMLQFQTDYSGIINELQSHNELKSFEESLFPSGDGSSDNIQELLNTTLPIGLVASGFLSNCALTIYLDIPMNNFLLELKNELKKDTGVLHLAYITRYTDDMMIISSNREIIWKSIQEINRLLGLVGLSLAEEKVSPKIESRYESLKTQINQLECLDKNSMLNIFLEKQLEEIKKSESPKSIKRRDRIPGSTAVIEKLSQIGENSLLAMNHEELDLYIRELLKLIDTTFEEREIKDETKVAFSSWRIRTGIAETTKRKRPFRHYRAKDRLLRAVEKYPFKVSLIDYYIMHLFDIAANEAIEQELESFLRQFSVSNEYNSENIGFYGSYLRTRVLLALADNWSLIPYSKRNVIQGVLFRAVMSWYNLLPIWHEKQAIYRMFTVTDITRDPGVIQVIAGESIKSVTHSYALFKMNLRESIHFHENSDAKKSLSASRLKVLLDIFKGRRGKEESARNVLVTEEEDFINWAWAYFHSLSPSEQNVDYWLDFSLILAKHSIKHIPQRTFQLWMKFKVNTIRNEAIHELIDLLDRVIEDWMRYKEGSDKYVKRFARALDITSGNLFFAYTKNRLINLARIKQALCMASNGLKVLPNDWKRDFIQDLSDNQCSPLNNVQIPLIDWLTAVSTSVQPDKSGLTNPLSELEALNLIYLFIKQLLKQNGDARQSAYNITTRRITISLVEWTDWRRSVKNGDSLDSQNFPKIDTPACPNMLDPELDRLKLISEYLNNFMNNLPESDKESIQTDHKDFVYCLALSVLILQMLSSNRDTSDYSEFSKLFQWHSIQQIILEGSGPSTSLTTLLISTLNMLLLIYQTQYHQLGQLKLPFKAMAKQNVITLEEYARRIEDHLRTANKNYLVWSGGILELISVDLNILAKDGRI